MAKPPNNEWLRQGASGPVPLGTPTHAGQSWREAHTMTREELFRIVDASTRCWREKKPVFRLVNTLRTQSCLAIFDERVPLDLQWMSDFMDPESPLCEPFMAMCAISAGTDNTIALNAALCFSILQSLQKSDTPPWYTLSEGLAHSLLATRLVGVYPGDVRLPFPGFFVELPPGMLTLINNITGHHEVRALSVAEGSPQSDDKALPVMAQETIDETSAALGVGSVPRDCLDQIGYGRRLLITAYCEPNENSVSPEDDNILYFSLPLDDETRTLEDLLERDHNLVGHDWRDAKVGGALAGVPRTNLELRNLLRGFVVNFLLYLASPKADVTHRNAARLSALRKGKRTHRVREQIARLTAEPLWEVGTHVRVDPRVRDALKDAWTTKGRAAAVNVLVQGYWRRQWTGKKSPENPKGTAWHMVQIPPLVRNYDPTKKVLAHEYEVEGNKR